jgi:PBP1b-binding outer membrane lipoprotein LpoB
MQFLPAAGLAGVGFHLKETHMADIVSKLKTAALIAGATLFVVACGEKKAEAPAAETTTTTTTEAPAAPAADAATTDAAAAPAAPADAMAPAAAPAADAMATTTTTTEKK